MRVTAPEIVFRARSYGASLAGVVAAERLRSCTSHRAPAEFAWLEKAGSVLVLGLAHPESNPELDWWDGRKGTPGNRVLIEVSERMTRWLAREFGVGSRDLPYHVENGGVFLKDAAALAGLGTIGRNNLLITPGFGPRVRLRAMLLDSDLEPGEQLEFDPCHGCDMPCLGSCPRDALPGGRYARERCDIQMDADRAGAMEIEPRVPGEPPGIAIRYCRSCELACPVGA